MVTQIAPHVVDGVYRYETAAMALELHAGTERHGVTDLRATGGAGGGDASSGTLVQPKLYLLNVYRLFAAGRLLAIARHEPFEATLEGGTVWLRWQPTEQHPARLSAAYTVPRPGTIDLTLDVVAERPLSRYEVLISSYFDFSLAPYALLPRRPIRAQRPAQPVSDDLQLLRMESSPFVQGNYIIVARDQEGIRLRLDGRYYDNTGQPAAFFASGQLYAAPVAVMGRDDLHVVQMTHREVCPGLVTTYVDLEAPPGQPEDNIAQHNALYFGFWGEGLAPGERRTAQLRQVLRPGPATLEGVLALHQAFLDELA